jgi:hypothetical protein
MMLCFCAIRLIFYSYNEVTKIENSIHKTQQIDESQWQ